MLFNIFHMVFLKANESFENEEFVDSQTNDNNEQQKPKSALGQFCINLK